MLVGLGLSFASEKLMLWLWGALGKGVHRLIGGVPISLGIGVRRGSRQRLGLAKGIGYPLARGCVSPRFGEDIPKSIFYSSLLYLL